MKKFKCLLTAMLLACSTASFAQFTNGGGGAGASSDVEAWKGLRFSYDRTFVSADDDKSEYGKYGLDVDGFQGFSVGYVQSFKIAKKLPIFFETGLGLNYARWSDSEDYTEDEDGYNGEDKYSMNSLGLTIPLNFVYGVKINDMLTIKPYTGFYLRINVMAKAKLKSEVSVPSDLMDMWNSYLGPEDVAEMTANFMENRGAGERDASLFDDKEMDEKFGMSKEAKWSRCQFGWQIGATLDINQFNVGIGYALDFNELAKETRTSKFALTVGMNF